MSYDKLKGKEFEAELKKLLDYERGKRISSVGRYGVQTARISSDTLIEIKSLPDFEGLVPGVQSQVIFDAKVCSAASFPLNKYRVTVPVKEAPMQRQLKHMIERSCYGAICGFVIHWNKRVLVKSVHPAETWWFPVRESMEFWADFESDLVASINREDCYRLGHQVHWETSGQRTRSLRPQVTRTIRQVAEARGVFKGVPGELSFISTPEGESPF